MSYSEESEEDKRRREEEEERVARERDEDARIEQTNQPGAEPLTDDKVYPQTAPTEPRVTHVSRTEEEEAAAKDEQPQEDQPTNEQQNNDDLP